MKHKHKFVVVKTIWPHSNGWGIICKRCRMILNTGLTKKKAEQRAEVFNK
jgi:hypothetical protein